MLAILGLLVFGLLSKGSGGIGVGDVAPAEPLPLLIGEGNGSLAEHRGSWVLVNFWASWCEPCREESPALEELQSRYGGKRFTVLGINTQDLGDDARAFISRFGLSYPQLRDGDGEASRAYGTGGVPESFLIDPRGIVRVVAKGPVTDEYLSEEVEPLLSKGAS